MKVLVTGSTGFLGRRLVSALLRRGHDVRALVRPARAVDSLPWRDRVEIARGDLRTGKLAGVVSGCDAVVHAAALVVGDAEMQLATTVRSTERMYDAMVEASCQRVVLVSSLSVYDWSKVRGKLDEQTPLEDGQRMFQRDAYAVSKLWQERLTKRYATVNDWKYTILRPGFIWGEGNMEPACLGQRIGKVWVNISPWSRPPFSYVDNCADAIAAAVGDERAHGEVFNVVDTASLTNAAYLRRLRRLESRRTWQIPLPYPVGVAMTRMATLTSRLLFGSHGKLPSLLVPRRFQARFKPVRTNSDRLTTELGWKPPTHPREAWKQLQQMSSSVQATGGKTFTSS